MTVMKQTDFYALLDTWENIHVLVDYLIEYPDQIEDLVDIGLNAPQKETWRAVWIMDRIHEKKPELVRAYIPRFIEALPLTNHESKLRHLLKLVSLNPLPQDQLGMLWDFGLGVFADASRPIAIRVHAMQLLFEITETVPDLKPELMQLIEHEMEFHGSAGIRSRGKKLLKKLLAAR
ncbi:hypothetical protein [Sunxiuqinia dokdonensis]|nr:hypothetical protein [Sunxiuqinia dokdonensis]